MPTAAIDRGGATRGDYENFLPKESFPVIRTGVNGEGAGTFFRLFLSAFGFFFSRLLRICPLAILSSLLFRCSSFNRSSARAATG